MKAMILAAGLGTRLRPLTDDRPKALVEIGGQTLLEITLNRLRSFGVREAIVNVHHFAKMIFEYLQQNHNFGMRVEVSHEEVLLDTGGGLKKAAHFFLNASESRTPFFVHNVDVISTIDLDRMLRFHIENQALATLAVQDRETSRYLLFDQQLRLCGRQAGLDQQAELVRSGEHLQPLAFSGIHILSPKIFSLMKGEGAFSIIDAYLELAGQGADIMAFRADGYYWRDVGSLANLRQAAQDLAQQDNRIRNR